MNKEILEDALRAPEFVPHTAPYGDFLVLVEPADAVHSRLISWGATVRYARGAVVYTWGLPTSEHVAVGHGIVDGRYVIGPEALPRQPERIDLGPCVSLSVAETVTVVSDAFGSQVVYYSDRLVTNRIHLAAAAQAGTGVDLDAMLTFAHSNNMFCQQYNVFDTPVPGVRMAHPGDQFRVDRGVTVVRSAEVSYDGYLDVGEYHDLIEAGAHEVIANVEAVIDSGRDVICDITGGQDSRVLFAAVVAAGRVADVRFHTKGIAPEEMDLLRTSSAGRAAELARLDVEIATSLVHEYGGRFDDGVGSALPAYRYTDVRANMMRRRSQSFGEYHFITPAVLRTHWLVPGAPRVRMMGGGGELYRNYYQPLFPGLDGDYTRESMGAALVASRNADVAWGDAWIGVEEKFLATFDELPGSTVHHKMDNHYFYFRNRFHFGLTESAPSGGINVNPVLSGSLIRAARMLPQEEKATGRVLFDVTKALVEKIAYHPYDKFRLDAVLSSHYHRPSRYDSEPVQAVPHYDLLPGGQSPDTASGLPRHPARTDLDLVGHAKATNAAMLHLVRSRRGTAVSHQVSEMFPEPFFASAYSLSTRALSWHSRFQSVTDHLAVSES